MFIISYNVPFDKVDEYVEKLQINDIYDVFYESLLKITTDENGYGYEEVDTQEVTLKVAFQSQDEDLEDLEIFMTRVNEILGQKPFDVHEEADTYEDFSMPAIHINDEWVIASPTEEFEDKKKINFISQGAFGTGLHETTQDLLRVILDKDFTGKRVLDIGTGSGILSLATAMKNASEVVALDIRDIKDEVEFNAALNNLTNIKPLVGDALTGEVNIEGKFDWIYINIGGEETHMFMDFIKEHIKEDGKLLVSGIVEWSFEKVREMIESYGFKMIEKHQSAEWVTIIFE
ncbi:[LSU ribosomal protein L11P]-lysine N-methyltransferase [Clostridium sp. DSM 8431]|uniref:50S ribosomal protein L11 methyltransferase n=1 Tax=Clostridium sp. DSM 8431 TaxID=1761781 RepID=UPI0008F3F6AF|nr:50S ribosomal protein L11 methyltransferase [Clostridium sp. DSM 8431]SFU33660.1 [LSU ribosomal protein L11P]-lysine N-methyltransferase [Clostridium sp. DSM 8431]